MALAVTLRINSRDEKGATSFTKIRVPTGFSISQYLEFGEAMCQLIASINLVQVTSASIVFGIDISALPLKPAAGLLSDIAEKALFIFNTVVAGFRTKLRLPAFDETFVTPGSDVIDTADPSVAAFTAAMTNGIVTTGGTIGPVNGREFDVDALIEAREVKRRTLS